jgi:hypothetical protein
VFWKVTSTSTPPLSDASRRFLRVGHHRRAKARGGGGGGGGGNAADVDGRLFVLSVCCCEGSRGGWCACGCGCAAVRGCAAGAPSGRSANASSEYVDRRKVDAFLAAAAAFITAATVPVASTPRVRVDSFFAASTAAFGSLPPPPPPARPSV